MTATVQNHGSLVCPIVALDKQSIPVTSNVMLTVALNMPSPPEMAKLDALKKRLRQKSEPSIEAAPKQPPREAPINNGPGILGTIGAFAFGVGLTDAVFGARHR